MKLINISIDVPHFLVVMVLALTAMLMPNGATTSDGASVDEYGRDASQEVKPLKPTDLHSNLLSTLEVTRDSCYIFLRPNYKSDYFGPLAKGEKVKWLDSRKDWIQVWIPRLRVSGWIHNTMAEESSETTSSPVKVPENLLSTVTVMTKLANIRETPTTRSKIITVAKEGQEFWLLNKKKNWYQIWLSDLEKKGWIYNTLVTKKQKQKMSP
jgi:uncharacterized protein YgiM (DUF1202 family)